MLESMIFVLALDMAAAYALLAAAIGSGIVVIGAALGIGKIGASGAEGIARQPEADKKISGVVVLTAALIEGVALFGLVICFLVWFKVG